MDKFFVVFKQYGNDSNTKETVCCSLSRMDASKFCKEENEKIKVGRAIYHFIEEVKSL